jgi:hypothetical protein
MKAAMPRKDVIVIIGAVINANWGQGKMKVDWLRSPEEVLRDCVRICTGIFEPERYSLEYGRPWKDDHVLTAVPSSRRNGSYSSTDESLKSVPQLNPLTRSSLTSWPSTARKRWWLSPLVLFLLIQEVSSFGQRSLVKEDEG